MDNNSRIPLDHFADFFRCTLYRDPTQPELGTTASFRYEAAMEAMDQHLTEKIKMHARGEVHPDDYRTDECGELINPKFWYCGLKGRAPIKPTMFWYEYPQSAGGAIFHTVIWRNGVGMPVEMVPPALRVSMGFHPEVA